MITLLIDDTIHPWPIDANRVNINGVPMNHSTRANTIRPTPGTLTSVSHKTRPTHTRVANRTRCMSLTHRSHREHDLLIATCRTKLSACQFLVRSFPLFRTHRVSSTRHYQDGRLVLTPLSSCGRSPDVERTMGVALSSWISISFERGRRNTQGRTADKQRRNLKK